MTAKQPLRFGGLPLILAIGLCFIITVGVNTFLYPLADTFRWEHSGVLQIGGIIIGCLIGLTVLYVCRDQSLTWPFMIATALAVFYSLFLPLLISHGYNVWKHAQSLW